MGGGKVTLLKQSPSFSLTKAYLRAEGGGKLVRRASHERGKEKKGKGQIQACRELEASIFRQEITVHINEGKKKRGGKRTLIDVF